MTNCSGEAQSVETQSNEEVSVLAERLRAIGLLRFAALSPIDESSAVLELGDSLDVEDVARVLYSEGG